MIAKVELTARFTSPQTLRRSAGRASCSLSLYRSIEASTRSLSQSEIPGAGIAFPSSLNARRLTSSGSIGSSR